VLISVSLTIWVARTLYKRGGIFLVDAFHGNAEMVEEILRYNPPLECTDADFNGTPLRWAIYGSKNGWHCDDGNYPATVEVLLNAGAKLPNESQDGTESVKEVLRRHGHGGGK